jgi:hypothetical protein
MKVINMNISKIKKKNSYRLPLTDFEKKLRRKEREERKRREAIARIKSNEAFERLVECGLLIKD